MDSREDSASAVSPGLLVSLVVSQLASGRQLSIQALPLCAITSHGRNM